jgi:hypothetical protein
VEGLNARTVTTMPADAPGCVQGNLNDEAVGLYAAGDLIAVFAVQGEGGRVDGQPGGQAVVRSPLTSALSSRRRPSVPRVQADARPPAT